MQNWISKVTANVISLFKGLEVKRFLAVALVGFVVLTTGMNVDSNNQAAAKRIDQLVHQGDSNRPKTTGDFQDEVRGDVPLGDRIKNTVRDSVEAVEDFGEMYPDTADRSTDALEDNNRANRLAR